MTGKIYGLSVVLGVFCTLMAVVMPYTPAESAMELKNDCSLCHLSHGAPAAENLKGPVNEICLGCHPDRLAPQEHPVGIKPEEPVTGLPFDTKGLITCATCHNPHSDASALLRLDRAELCRACHRDK